MHDHFEEGDGGDAHVLEVVGVFAPSLVLGALGVGGGGETIESVALGVNELNEVLGFWGGERLVRRGDGWGKGSITTYPKLCGRTPF